MKRYWTQTIKSLRRRHDAVGNHLVPDMGNPHREERSTVSQVSLASATCISSPCRDLVAVVVGWVLIFLLVEEGESMAILFLRKLWLEE